DRLIAGLNLDITRLWVKDATCTTICPSFIPGVLMDRRDFLFATGALGLASVSRPLQAFVRGAASAPDHTLRITHASFEVAHGRVVQTTGYNGGVPGPLIRLKQGVPVTMDLVNETSSPEFIHFHGLATSIIVDGAEEEGSPVLAAGATRR